MSIAKQRHYFLKWYLFILLIKVDSSVPGYQKPLVINAKYDTINQGRAFERFSNLPLNRHKPSLQSLCFFHIFIFLSPTKQTIKLWEYSSFPSLKLQDPSTILPKHQQAQALHNNLPFSGTNFHISYVSVAIIKHCDQRQHKKEVILASSSRGK